MKPDPSRPGIYRITCPKGRSYIGSSVRPIVRWRQHRHELKRGRHHSPALQAIASAHGLDSLTFEVIENVEPEQLEAAEQGYFDRERPALNAIYEAGAGRMHRDPVYRANLKAALAAANARPSYAANRRAANPQKRAVRCLNDGRVFESCSEAARAHGISSGSVSACATGQTVKTRSGLRFQFVGAEGPPRESRIFRRAVQRVDTGECFVSIFVAAKAVGVSRTAIHCSLKRGWKCCGTHWRLVDPAAGTLSTNEA